MNDAVLTYELTDEDVEQMNNDLDEIEAEKYLNNVKSKRESIMKSPEEASSTVRDTIVEKTDGFPVRMEFMGEFYEFLPVKVNGELTEPFQDIVPNDFARNMQKFYPKSYRIVRKSDESISRTKPNKYVIPPRRNAVIVVAEEQSEDTKTIDTTKLLPVTEQKKITKAQKAAAKNHGKPTPTPGAMPLPSSDDMVTEADLA